MTWLPDDMNEANGCRRLHTNRIDSFSRQGLMGAAPVSPERRRDLPTTAATNREDSDGQFDRDEVFIGRPPAQSRVHLCGSVGLLLGPPLRRPPVPWHRADAHDGQAVLQPAMGERDGDQRVARQLP